MTTPVTELNDNKARVAPEVLDGIALAFVGSVVPDTPEFHTTAFSRAGVMFQQNLLSGMKCAGLEPSLILSVRPMPSFPRSRVIWSSAKEAMLPADMPVHFLPYINVTPMKQVAIGISTLWNLLRWGWKNRCKQKRVIYSFNLTVPPGIFIMLAAKLAKAKYVVSLNDINEPGQTVPNTLLNRIDFCLQKMLIPRLDGHVAVSDRIMSDFAPGKPYIRLEGGVTKEMVDRTERAYNAQEDSNRPFIIATAGSLDEANGFGTLLEAFSLLEGDNYRLRIAGGGPMEADVRLAAAKDSRIEYLGFVSLDEVLALYKSADVLLNMRLTKMLSTRYFFPSKLMEFLVSGTPVISTCTGHVEEEFGNYCYLLKDESPQGLAEVISRLASIDAKELADKGNAARAYMIANKTWEALGRKVVRFILETVLNMEPGRC